MCLGIGRKAFLLCCGCSFLLGLAFFFFVHEPAVKAAEEFQAEEEKILQEKTDLDNFLNAHRDFQAYSTELAQRQEHVEHILPTEMGQGNFIGMLQQKALSRNVALQAVVPGELQQEGLLQKLPVEVTLQCNYFQLLDFLEAFQQDRFLRIEGGSIQSSQGRLSCHLRLMIFALDDSSGSS